MIFSRRQIKCLIVFGVSLCILGVLLIPIFPFLLEAGLKQQIVLRPGSESFKKWQNLPIVIYLQFYIFNVTNPEDFSNGSIAKLEQRGPYTYREVRKRLNITWNDDETITFRDYCLYYFERDMSVGPENEKFTLLNVPLLAVIARIEALGFLRPIGEWILKFLAHKETLFQELTAKQIIWGYQSELLKELKLIQLVTDDMFGLFYGRNASDDGYFSIFTGNNHLNLFGQIYTWNNQRKLPYWKTEYCNMINGTDGTLIHPLVEKTDILYVFNTDICRSVWSIYEKEVIFKGIPGYKFSAPKELFENISVNPDNAGFCIPYCLGTGVLNVSVCKQGAPIILSCPHYYMADLKYINSVEGLSPSRNEHETYAYLEPTSGLILEAMKRLQINIAVTKIPYFKQLANVNSVFLPIIWINESARLDDDDIELIKNRILLPITIVSFLKMILITSGILILFSLLLYIAVTVRRKDEYEELSSERDASSINNTTKDMSTINEINSHESSNI